MGTPARTNHGTTAKPQPDKWFIVLWSSRVFPENRIVYGSDIGDVVIKAAEALGFR